MRADRVHRYTEPRRNLGLSTAVRQEQQHFTFSRAEHEGIMISAEPARHPLVMGSGVPPLPF